MAEQGNVIFREVQYSRQPWLWLVVILSVALTAGIFGCLVYQQTVLGRPAGNMSPTALIVVAVVVILFDIGLLALFLSAHLVTEVRTDGLHIRYFPFHLSFHRIPLENATNVETRTYNPIRDYGGWGIRWTRDGKAYNPTGNMGVRIDYKDGKHVLIGSGRADELVSAIESVH